MFLKNICTSMNHIIHYRIEFIFFINYDNKYNNNKYDNKNIYITLFKKKL